MNQCKELSFTFSAQILCIRCSQIYLYYHVFLLRLAVCCSHASWWLVYFCHCRPPDMLPVIDLCTIVDACSSLADYLYTWLLLLVFSLCCWSFLYFPLCLLFFSTCPCASSRRRLSDSLLSDFILSFFSLSLWGVKLYSHSYCNPPLISASLSLVLFFFCCAVSRTASRWKYVSPSQPIESWSVIPSWHHHHVHFFLSIGWCGS